MFCYCITHLGILLSSNVLLTHTEGVTMNIGVDFDGVICDYGRLKSDVARMLFWITIPSGQLKRQLILESGILTQCQYQQLLDVVHEDEAVVGLMRPISQALLYLESLIRDSHRVTVISSRAAASIRIAQEWLTNNGLLAKCIGVGPGVSKGQASRGLHIFVDDDLEKLQMLVQIVPRLIFFSRGHSQHSVEGNITCVSSWSELHTVVVRSSTMDAQSFL